VWTSNKDSILVMQRLSKVLQTSIVFGLLGIVLNALVIYACAYFIHDSNYVRHDPRQLKWIVQAPTGFPIRPQRVDEWTGFGTRHLFAYADGLAMKQGNVTTLRYVQWQVEAGWPWYGCSGGHSLVTDDVKIISEASARALVLGQAQPGGVRLLPLKIDFSSFGIGAAFYALATYLIAQFCAQVRRMMRSKRGVCPACAYPVGTSDVCTECGRATPTKR